MFGIKIQYPSDWVKKTAVEKLPNKNTHIAEFDNPTRSNLVEILIKDLDGTGTSLQQYLDTEIDLDKSLKSFKLLEANTDASLSNQPAYLTVYTFKIKDGKTFKTREIGTIIDDRAYVIRYLTEPADYFTDLPSIDKMVDSFKINRN